MHPVRTTVLPAVLAAGLVAAGVGTATAGPTTAGPTATRGPATAAPAGSRAYNGFVVQGAILARYSALGGALSYLGLPLSNELTTPNRIGRYSVFQGGSIYWSGSTGAWDVHGVIRDSWGALGYENSVAGLPVGGEYPLARGAFQRFQGSQIYTSTSTGTFEVHGDIFKDWGGLGYENGVLGFPLTNELPTPDRPGAFNAFEGGAVYWSPDTGAAEVQGDIRQKWASIGWENSPLGFPVSDEVDSTLPDGRGNVFEDGVIEWTPQMGALITSLIDVPSAVDKDEKKITFSDAKQSFTYDDNDHYFRITDPDPTVDPAPITQADFEDELKVGSLVLIDQYLEDPAQETYFALVDIPGDPTHTASKALLRKESRRVQ